MKKRGVTLFVLIAVILSTAGLAPVIADQPDGVALVQIAWQSQAELAAVETSSVPVYARLAGESGAYLLAGATPREIEALQAGGLGVTILDPDIYGASYYLAYAMPGLARLDWEAYGRLLLDDGVQVLLRATSQEVERLARAGVQLQAVTFDPKPLGPAPARGTIPTDVDPDPLIQAMIDQVDQTTVYSYTGDLSGEWPVEVGGMPYTIVTRHTYSGPPIEKATQFVGEHLTDLGLAVEYHQWGGATYPNVIGELPGLVNPDDIFIIGAHLDDMPSGPVAPGADDNASGSVATLLAADLATQYQWGCTLRFALWTGEEQGLNGSHAYAQRSYNLGENIVGYLNLDMIAWNSAYSSPDIDLHANASLPDTLVLAQLFADVVDAYNLDLIPQIVPNGTGASDHASFWQYGYTAILGIEDFSDFNPYYHTTADDMDNFQDWPYYVEFVKASIATFAHMSGCLIPAEMGALDGHVTAASSGDPIAEATVTIDDGSGHTFAPTTDPSGYYTQILTAGTYTVTASKTGYFSETVAAVDVQAGMVTTQDFALQPMQAIAVEPQALEATLYPGDATTQTLWVTNTGVSDLTFAVHELSRTLTVGAGPLVQPRAEPVVDPDVVDQVQAAGQAEVIIHHRGNLGGVSYDIPWLSIDPTGATLGPGEGISLSAAFDASGLEPGAYLGLLDVESDDLVAPHVSVPVTLTVELEFCAPVDVVTVTTEISACAVAFGAELTGTEPYTYAWDFGAFGAWSVPTPTIDFGASGTYPFTLTVSNCSAVYSDTMTGTVAVECAAPTWYLYLPLVVRGG